jgi:hypothetical protein
MWLVAKHMLPIHVSPTAAVHRDTRQFYLNLILVVV